MYVQKMKMLESQEQLLSLQSKLSDSEANVHLLRTRIKDVLKESLDAMHYSQVTAYKFKLLQVKRASIFFTNFYKDTNDRIFYQPICKKKVPNSWNKQHLFITFVQNFKFYYNL